jgi:hypothetical protein
VPVELAPDAVAAFRLRRQGLGEGERRGLVALCGALAGVQAQVLEGAEHAVALRTPGADVRRALWQERSLVRTYTWRGTFHLVPAAELELWLAAAAPGVPRPPKVPAERHDALAEAIGAALDGAPLTRGALGEEVGRRLGDRALGERIAGPGGDMLVKQAAARGLLVLADPDGRATRLQRPERWLGRALREVAAEEADAHALRAFLAAYGPADAAELARWSGRGSARRAQAWRDALGDEVADVSVDGRAGWLLGADLEEAAGARAAPAVRLLPAWDPLTVALPALVPADHYKQVFASAGRVEPVVLVDGRVTGTWRFTRRGARAEVELQPFAGAYDAPTRERIAQAAAGLGEALRAERVVLAG